MMTDPASGEAANPTASAAASGQPAEHHLNLLGVIQGLMVIVVVVTFVLAFVAQPFRIPSESMEPTLLIGDFVVVDKVSLAPAGEWHWLLPYRSVERGDVVVFRRPDADNAARENYLVKRVAAVPGDHLRLQQGRLVLDGVAQPEKQAVFLPSGPDAYRDEFPASLYTDVGVEPEWWVQMHKLVRDGELVVPEGSYFMMGDNRNHSLDSRYWGFVPRQQIVGHARLVYFSLRTPSPDDAELAAQTSKAALRSDSIAKGTWLDFARWGRLFRIVH